MNKRKEKGRCLLVIRETDNQKMGGVQGRPGRDGS